MNLKPAYLLKIALLVLMSNCKTNSVDFTNPKDTPNQENLAYFGEMTPGIAPKIFAPGLISKEDRYEFGCTISRDGTEFYFGVDNNGKMEIHRTILTNGKWSDQENLFPDDVYRNNDPMFSNDDQRIYFISDRPRNINRDESDINLWYIERDNENWSNPIPLNSNINNHLDQYYSSFTQDGSLYYASSDTSYNAPRYAFDIYKSKMKDGEYQAPEKLPEEINTNRYEADVFVAPDESYVIFCSIRKDGLGSGDLYISFKDDDGKWTEAKTMGPTINTSGHELCPYVTPDGKYFFYTSNKDIYWVSTKFIDQLKQEIKGKG